MKLLVISGLSGSGKSVALHTLEDMGYYCVDNLPVTLMCAFGKELLKPGSSIGEHAAVGIDARNHPDDLRRLPEILKELKGLGFKSEIVFLQAEDTTLLKRFSETRRKHPLSTGNLTLAEAIQQERTLLEPFAANADLLIDTTHTNLHQLRELLMARLGEDRHRHLSLLFQSFGYKHGVPTDADFVFDARCLPNPHWEPKLRSQTGRDQDVVEFLQCHPEVARMFDSIRGFLETWIPSFEAENRSYITVAVGCTGGQHRSVYLVERLGQYFRQTREHVITRHRELGT